MEQPSTFDADVVAYLVKIHDSMPSGVGAKFKELHGEVVRFVSALRRPYPDEWIYAVNRSYEAFQEEAYRFRFDSRYVQLEERAAEAARELEAFMKKVRELPPSRAELPVDRRQAAWSLVERFVEVLPEEAARKRTSVGYTEELQQFLRLGKELLAKH